MAMKHWSHKFADTPFGCNFAATNTRSMIIKFLLFLLGLILIPIIFIGLPVLFGIGYGLYGGMYLIVLSFTYRNYQPKCKDHIIRIVLIILSFPAAAIVLGLGIAGGAIVTAIAALFVIPAIIFHVYLFFRSVLWWRKNLKIAKQ